MAESPPEIPLLIGPQPDVKYPITVEYCGNCGMPFEYCEYYPDKEGCKKWLESNLPDQFEKLATNDADDGDGDEKKRQKRGGKGAKKIKKKESKTRLPSEDGQMRQSR